MSTSEQPEVAAKNKILHVLSIYPKLSPSMLQTGIGPALSKAFWGPTFQKMVSDGLIHEEQVSKASPSGRNNTYTIISLTDKGLEAVDA